MQLHGASQRALMAYAVSLSMSRGAGDAVAHVQPSRWAGAWGIANTALSTCAWGMASSHVPCTHGPWDMDHVQRSYDCGRGPAGEEVRLRGDPADRRFG